MEMDVLQRRHLLNTGIHRLQKSGQAIHASLVHYPVDVAALRLCSFRIRNKTTRLLPKGQNFRIAAPPRFNSPRATVSEQLKEDVSKGQM